MISIGQMAIAIALLGFDDLGRSVTPTFLLRNGFFFTIISTFSKLEQKLNVGSLFLSTGHGILPSCGCKVRETMVSQCDLVL